jgi:hypothetical protein
LRIKHYGSIDDKGKLTLSNPDNFKSDLQKLKGKNRVYIVVDEEKPSRSSNQNKYYWSVIIGTLSSELGYTTDEMHEVLKEKFLPKREIDLLGDKIKIGSSAKLKTDEFEKYLEDIRRFAAEKLNIIIPLPNEILEKE